MKCNKTDCLHHKVCQEWVTLGNDNYINESDGYCNLYQSFQKSGKWIERKNIPKSVDIATTNLRWKYECTECSREVRSKYRFCPNCGARMESEVDNG